MRDETGVSVAMLNSAASTPLRSEWRFPVGRSELFRTLSADEAAELAPLPDTDVETPTTSLSESAEQSTATVSYSGVAASADSDSENDDLPDPAPVKEK